MLLILGDIFHKSTPLQLRGYCWKISAEKSLLKGPYSMASYEWSLLNGPYWMVLNEKSLPKGLYWKVTTEMTLMRGLGWLRWVVCCKRIFYPGICSCYFITFEHFTYGNESWYWLKRQLSVGICSLYIHTIVHIIGARRGWDPDCCAPH